MGTEDLDDNDDTLDVGDENIADDADVTDGDIGDESDVPDADTGEGDVEGDADNNAPDPAAELAAERERRIRAEALAEERARVTSPSASIDPAAARRERQAMLEAMDPDQRREFLHNETLQNMQNQILFTQLKTEDTIDKSSYALIANSNTAKGRIYSKHAAEVERRLASERNQGRNWPRETILAQIIGETALKEQNKPDAAKTAARARVNSATTKPVNNRSNSQPAPRKQKGFVSVEQFERDYGDVTF